MPLRSLVSRLQKPGNFRGVLLMLLSAWSAASMNGAIRHVSDDLHPFEIAFFRNLFGLVVLVPVFFRLGIAPLRTHRIGLHALRGLFNVGAMLTYFLAVSMTPLATVAALAFTAPLFATLGTVLILKEAMGIRRWISLVVGFIGALVILRPGVDEVSLGAMLVISSSASWAMALLVIRVLGRTETSLTTTIYAGVFLSPISLLTALPVWVWPDTGHLLWLSLVGGLGTIGQIAVAQAFREAEPTAILPMDFTKLIWSALIGYLAFAEIPDLWTLAGGTIIFLSVVYIALRESRFKQVQPFRAAGPTA